MPRSEKPLSKKKKFIKDGVFYAELNDLLGRELAEHGYAGCEIRVTPARTEVIIRATNTQSVVGKDGRTIRELTALIQKRFKFAPGAVMLFAEKVRNKGLSALAQAEAVKYRLTEGLSVRRACYSVLRFVMDSGAKGCEVTISGKLRGQRAKSMKFREGYMIHAGDPVRWYIDTAVKHILLRQGVLGVKVKIMLPFDPTGQLGGPQKDLPDVVKIHEPKEVEPQGSSGYSGGGGGGRGDAYAGQIDQSQADYHQYAPDQQQAQQQPQQPQQPQQSTQSTQPAQPAQQQSQQPQQAQQSSNYQQQSGSGQQDYDQSQQFGYEDTGYEQYGQFGGAQQGQYGQGYTEEQDQQYGYDVNYDQRQGGQQQSGQGFQQGYGRGYQQF